MNITAKNFKPSVQEADCTSTQQALLVSSFLQEPLIVLMHLYPMILLQEWHASHLQIGVYMILRPLLGLLAFQLSSYLSHRDESLVLHLVVTGILCRLPFLLMPWVEGGWTMIGCAAIYFVLLQSGMPTWLELLKRNLSQRTRERLFSLGALIGYIEGAILAILLGNLLKHGHGSWRWLYPVAALLGILSLLWHSKMPVRWRPATHILDERGWLAPWKKAWSLLSQRPLLRSFHLGFMGCGSSAVLVNAVLYYYYQEIGFSYKEVLFVKVLVQAVGYALSLGRWRRLLDRTGFFVSSSVLFLTVAAFPMLLLLGHLHALGVWGAFFVHGISLAGNHLIWNLSPLHFSGSESSAPYSGVNVLMEGLRTLVMLLVGLTLHAFLGSLAVMMLSIGVACISAWYMWHFRSLDASQRMT